MTTPDTSVLALDERWITPLSSLRAETIHNQSTRRTSVLLPVAIPESLVSMDALAVIPEITNTYYYQEGINHALKTTGA